MQGGSHRKIILLLSISLVSIIFVQAFWLRNFYIEKKEQFRSSVYSGLEQVADKLHEREQLKVIKERGDSLLSASKQVFNVLRKKKKKRPPASSLASRSAQTAIIINDNTMIMTGSPADLAVAAVSARWGTDSLLAVANKQLRVYDKKVEVLNEKMRHISYSIRELETAPGPVGSALSMAGKAVRPLDEDSAREADLEALMGRLLTEIHTEKEEETDPDSLRQVIATVLRAKGLVTPFEFSLRRTADGRHEYVVQSAGFDSTRHSFSADMSSKRLVKRNSHLLLQFPDEDNVVMASMKGSLFLSLLFLGIILSVFYYTLRLIMQQKKISDIRNDFVNNMTHELKTPIATISLAVDAMQHPQVRASEQRYNEYTRILKEENRKLNSHVERVLQLALFDKGQFEMNRRVVDVAALAGAQVRAYGLRAESNGQQLFFNCTGFSFRVWADEEHLGSAISNLIDNAIKYTGKNGFVNVNVASDDTHVSVSVSDSGCGISKDDLGRVFDKFFRVNNNDLHDVKGFGIGLSYVKSIVEAHGGQIVVRSEPGKGSEFRITLDRHE